MANLDARSHLLRRLVRATTALIATMCIGLVLTAVPASAATTLYVDGSDPSCSDAGPGTSGQPFCTITRGTKVANAGDTVLVAAGAYSGTASVQNSGTPGSPIVVRAAAGATVTLTTTSGPGIRVSGQSYVTVQGFVIEDTPGVGIIAQDGSNVSILGNTVTRAGSRVDSTTIASGIVVKNCSACLVDGNSVSDNSDHGILLSAGTTGTTVIRNRSFANARGYTRAAAGIAVYGAAGNTIEANITYGNEDTGVQMRPGANANLVVANRSYDNGDHGFDTLGSTGVRYISNVAYGNYKDGISIEGSSTGASVYNNISVENGLTTDEFDLWVSENSAAGFSSDRNIFWNSTSQTPIKFNGVRFATVAAFAAATGNDQHGIGADPLFAAPASGDFHLTAGSPAIDSADSGVTGERSVDAEGNARRDDQGVPNSGVGPRTYDDRGALEFAGTSSGGNHTPTAQDDSASVTANSSNNLIDVLANDSDADNDTLTIQSVGAPSHGSASISSGKVSYTPTANYSGGDTFTYVVSDGHGGTATGTVTVTVNAAGGNRNPIATDDVASVATGVTTAINVLANDSDPDGDTLTIASVGRPAHGTASISSGKVAYTPARGYVGPDAFTYAVTDGKGGTATATVSLTVGGTTTTNHPPVANPDSATVAAGSSNNLIDVLANDTDQDGNALTLSSVGAAGHGTTAISSGKASYTPTSGYSGPDSFTYVVSDGKGGTATGTVSVTVQGSSGGTNLVTNPGFETSTTGWASTNSRGTTLARTNTVAHDPSAYSGVLTNIAPGPCGITDAPGWVPTTTAGTYTVSMWVRAGMAGQTLTLRVRELWNGSQVGISTASVSLSTTWQKVQVALSPTHAGQSSLDVDAMIASAPTGTCFYVDDVSIVRT